MSSCVFVHNYLHVEFGMALPIPDIMHPQTKSRIQQTSSYKADKPSSQTEGSSEEHAGQPCLIGRECVERAVRICMAVHQGLH